MSRFRFNPVGGHPSQPWFRIGEFDVTTTILAIAVTIFSMVVYAADSSAVEEGLGLLAKSVPGSPIGVIEGGVWKLVTWPLVNKPTGWAFVSLLLFFFWGSRLEGDLGRKRMAWLLLWMILIPALLTTLLVVATSDRLFYFSGMRYIGVGIFIAFAVEYPQLRFFFNIPAWVIAVGFVFLDVLGILSDREFVGNHAYYVLFLYTLVLATAIFVMRQLGLADAAHFIPRINWPGMARSGAAGRAKPSKAKRRSKADLRVVPPTVSYPSSPPMMDRTTQEEVDSLLDKIAAHGLDSLTADERRRLDQASKRLRGDK